MRTTPSFACFDAGIAQNAVAIVADVVDIAIDIAAFFFGLAGFVVEAVFIFGTLHAAAVTGGAADSRILAAAFAGSAFRAIAVIYDAGITVAYFIFKARQTTAIACIMTFSIETALISSTQLAAAGRANFDCDAFAILAFFVIVADIIATFVDASVILANLIG